MVKDKLVSLEWWTKLFGSFAVLGIVLVLVGRIAKVKAIVLVGVCMGAPILALGGLLLLVGVPYILLEGRRQRRKG